MRTVDATSKAAFLSVASKPETRAYLRKIALDFGSSPIVMADNGNLETGAVGEDYYGRYILGSTCLDSADNVVRVVNKAAEGESSDYFHMLTASPHTPSNWDYTDTTGGPSISAYCRLGIYPTGSTSHVYVWYASSADDKLYYVDFNANNGSFGSPVGGGLDIGAWDSLAIHPVSTTLAMVVGFTDPYLWVGMASWGGVTWNSFTTHVVACIPDAEALNFAQFSSVVKLGSANMYSVLINMVAHGAVYSLLYDGDAEVFSQPRLAVGANADWGGIRAFVSGAAWINGRVWAVVNRAIESADGEPQAYHTMLISSPDGLNWREEDFIGEFPCYGVPLVLGNYMYVAGNAVVYEADATQKVGVDNSSLKTELTDVVSWSMNVASNAPGTISIPALRGDNSTVDEDLLQPGAEVQVQVRDNSGGWVDMYGGYVERIINRDAYGSSKAKRTVKGPISRLAGGYAFHHPMGIGFDSPIVWDTDFNSDRGLAKISVRQVTGLFKVEYDPVTGKWELQGERGIAVVPSVVRTQWLQAKMHATPEQSIEGLYFVFYYEDEDNYWRAGLQRDAEASSADLVIEQVYQGEAAEKAKSSSVASTAGQEMTMMLSLKPGSINIRINVNSSSEDFVTSSTSLSYDTFTNLCEVPCPHHIGIEVGERQDYVGAIASGESESATAASITDTGVFSSSYGGKWINCNDEWRRITSADANTAYVTPNWMAIPPNGSEFGVYDNNRGPYARFSNISFCDGNGMWTVGDIAEAIMQVAGVNLVDKVETSVGALGTGDIYAYDVDIALSEDCSVAIHATEGASPNYYSVEIDGTNSKVTLKRYVAGSPTTIAVYPSLVDTSDADATFRVVHYRDNVYVYCCGHFVTAFYNVKTAGYGRIAVSSGTGTVGEFQSMIESFIWDAAQPATSALAKLLRGRPGKMIEVPGGTGAYDQIKVSTFDDRDSLGTWANTVVQVEEGVSPAPALVEMEGEDAREYFLDVEQARKGILFRRAKSEFARGTQQTRSEARRVMRLGKSEAQPCEISLSLPDLSAEPEDKVTVGDTTYVITGIQYSAGMQKQGLAWGAKYAARPLPTVPTAGVWGTDEWGDFTWG